MTEDRITQRTITAVMIVIAALAFVFSFGNVWSLALRLGVPGPIAPLIAPIVDLSVVGLLIALRYLALHGLPAEQMTAATRLMHFSGLLTLALNVAEPVVAGHYGRAAVDAVAPLLLLGWGSVGPQLLRAFHTVARPAVPTPPLCATESEPETASDTSRPAAPLIVPAPAAVTPQIAPAPASPAAKVPEPLLPKHAPSRRPTAPSTANRSRQHSSRRDSGSACPWPPRCTPLCSGCTPPPASPALPTAARPWARPAMPAGSSPSALNRCCPQAHLRARKDSPPLMRRPLDLRHVISPGLRDLVELANTDDFDRVTEQVRDLRGCTSPVNLHGWTLTTDQTTQQVVRSYRSEDEPSGRLLTTCGNRRASRCPACSRLYAADTYHLIKAGLSGGKNVAEAVRDHPRAFVTLTAPSFGPVHNRPTTDAGKPRPCACGESHPQDAPELGTPLRPTSYDYAGAVLWNAHAGALWARFTTYLRRALAEHLGMTQKALNTALRVSFAKVAEYQQRGLVHFHAVVRFDGPDGHTTSPPAWATFDALRVAVGLAVERARLTVESDAVGERVIRWGDRFKVDQISALGDGELTDAKVAGYVAKYATKNAEGAGTVDRTLVCRPCAGRGYVRGPDAFRDLCADCDGTGQAEPLTDLPVQQHSRQMIRTAWALGHLPEFAHLKLWKWAHMLGFRGHFSSKSRAYSTTLGALRDVRRAWRTAQAEAARIRAGLPIDDENTTLVTASSWTYLSSGYSPGEELLAAQVRHDRTLSERLKSEGAPWL